MSCDLTTLRAFLALPPDASVRVHTYQHPGGIAAARARGLLTCDPAFVFSDGSGGATGPLAAYGWLRDRMRERSPAVSGDLPVFAWLDRPPVEVPSYFGPTVLLTAEIPRWRVLASWHDGFLSVVNGDRYAVGDDGDEGEATREEIEASWLGVLDVENPLLWNGDGEAEEDTIQLAVDRILVSEWLSVERVVTMPPDSE